MSFRIDYDDQLDGVVEKINDELREEGIPIQFVADDEEHDGFVIYNMVKGNTNG